MCHFNLGRARSKWSMVSMEMRVRKVGERVARVQCSLRDKPSFSSDSVEPTASTAS